MIREIFELYQRTLPDIIRSEEKVMDNLTDKSSHVICIKEDDKLIGVSVVNENTVYLLCVDENFRNRGVGAELLRQSEKYIASRDFDKVVLGAGTDYIMPGVPMNNNAHEFFKKRGYVHAWGDDTGCFDMSQSLSDFTFRENSVGDTINGITYRWAGISDLDKVLKCVNAAEEKFVQYYQTESFYKKGNDIVVLVAAQGSDILGTLHVCKEIEGKGVGTVGCTTTAPEHQGKGIATTMVKLGTKHLKDTGLSSAFLGYTYTGIVSMYSRAGYKVCMEYFMGEKKL
ncbi:MAG: GNAT family N-acetyltransferase [Defluviitaleaceae bacterium]|nr:GNAT family N-acetyltransferase [Defluviitaleaceae bacterium]